MHTTIDKSILSLRSCLAVLLLVTLFVGCRTVPALSPETGAVQAARAFSSQRWQIDPASVEVVAQHDWDGLSLVLVSFLANQPEGTPGDCLALYRAERAGLGWDISGAPDCSLRSPNANAFHYLRREEISPGQPATIVYGSAMWPATASIRAVWSDGQEQIVAAQQKIYLLVRDGELDLQEMQELDETGKVLNEYQPPQAGDQVIVE